jgi:hypothetical protein
VSRTLKARVEALEAEAGPAEALTEAEREAELAEIRRFLDASDRPTVRELVAVWPDGLDRPLILLPSDIEL